MQDFLMRALNIAVETIWPTRCAICDIPGKVICDNCFRKLIYIDIYRACPRCGAPFGRVQCTECCHVLLEQLGLTSFPLDGMIHALILDERAKRIVSAFKDKDERRLINFISTTTARYVPPDLKTSECIISYIPASAKAYRRRGFDHAQLISEAVATECHMECRCLFERPRSIDQRKLTRKERFANMQHIMTVKTDVVIPSSILLIDDVCTTGSTLYSAASVLRKHGAKHVFALTFGHVID